MRPSLTPEPWTPNSIINPKPQTLNKPKIPPYSKAEALQAEGRVEHCELHSGSVEESRVENVLNLGLGFRV